MSRFIPITDWQKCNSEQQQRLLMRPAIIASAPVTRTVNEIIDRVRDEGDRALRDYNATFDNADTDTLRISETQISSSASRLSDETKRAMQVAAGNIEKFHLAQQVSTVDIETQPGVRCQQLIRPISSVGLYIPGGSAPLFSTVLMLAIPARLAQCPRVLLCSPPPVSDEILYAAQLCGVKDIFQIGGAQAIAALAFGTESVTAVDKIFGPGNAWVTEAKRQVSQHYEGAAIDMPAGPSEVMVIADDIANPTFVAADLLSQAEHGADSQVILLTPSQTLAEAVSVALQQQLSLLPRASIARNALEHSHLIVTCDLQQCTDIANRYGPEHLIIQTRQPRQLLEAVIHAGSVFLGDWSPESAGDYASGTNHVLPTYGHARTRSGLGLADFQKRMTVQELTPEGLLALAPTIETMAAAEQLNAHKNAVTLRVRALQEKP